MRRVNRDSFNVVDDSPNSSPIGQIVKEVAPSQSDCPALIYRLLYRHFLLLYKDIAKAAKYINRCLSPAE